MSLLDYTKALLNPTGLTGPSGLPLLPISIAHILALSFAAIYVGSLYVSNHTRLSFATDVDGKGVSAGVLQERERKANERWRDDPDVIRARLIAVSMASLTCCTVVEAIIATSTNGTLLEVMNHTRKYLGFTLGSSLLPHLITPILFLGPLYATYLQQTLPFQKFWFPKQKFLNLIGLRTYTLGPLTEEIVFRACVLAPYHLAGCSPTKMVFLTPLSFGLAHAHHAWDTYNRYGRTRQAALKAVLGSTFQLIYTTLFGFHAAYLFLRTGSLLPAFSAHAFCNIMGFPEVAYEIRTWPHRKYLIILLYLLGIAGYVYTLPRWTETPGSIFWPAA
ncbi:hypothetical protein DFP72DRAFT_970461 [Ephemerocybe angulata]|uniref:intramembrane prenyl-peptidase Rce1 n=1 Tax=Ephemerocybe angulata TaxID=980116 RepID=A0A8H6M049_9AGAR|nr:hypothetical protein DFP72DRAFT_970461 [Tulosesus angulatus]